MNIVLVVPTGIGCEIGGHAGDANPVAKLMGACCENLILHPNVVNSSDVNEMPENSWYVEGSCLNRFLRGEIYLEIPRLNKILIAVNKADWQSINAVSGARATIGSNVEIVELEKPLGLIAQMKDGLASGEVINGEPLVEQVPDLTRFVRAHPGAHEERRPRRLRSRWPPSTATPNASVNPSSSTPIRRSGSLTSASRPFFNPL